MDVANTESQRIEFKQSWRDEYLRVIAAFANGNGGELIIGMDDDGNVLQVGNIRRLQEDLPNKIRNRLGLTPSITIDTSDEHEVLKIAVRPSAIPISCDGRFYLRSGSTVQELKGRELSDFLLDKMGKTWDEMVEEGMTLDVLHKGTIQQFKKDAADRIPSIIQETDTHALLRKLKLLDDAKLKRAAILLFGEQPQQVYLQSIIKIGRFVSDTDIRFTDVVEGNLFQQLEKALDILRSKYLVSNIHYEGIHRRDVLEYPYEALREAIINALIHRDYAGTSHIQNRVYDNKLVIMNEGRLPPEIPAEKLKTDHLSLPRNPLLAQVFYYAGFIESWGRGTIKILEQCLARGLPEPDFIEENGVMHVTFHKDRWTQEQLQNLGLNDRQIRAVLYVREKGRITNREYREMTGLSDEGARTDLKDLIEKRILVAAGRGRNVHYRLA